ncbi:MAG: hypothetical protein V4621_01105 [Pseudomonadota bacterium]
MYQSPTGPHSLARPLDKLEQSPQAATAEMSRDLPANFPSAAVPSGLGIVQPAMDADDIDINDDYHAFTKGAFDSNTLRQFAAGIVMTAEDREEDERKKNGGQTVAEALDDLVDSMSDITEVQKEAMAAYRQTWLNEEQQYGDTAMTGRDIEDMNGKYWNDPRFRSSVHSRLRENGMSPAEIIALEKASERKTILSQIPEHMRTPAQQTEYQSLQNNKDVREFQATQAKVYSTWAQDAENNQNILSHKASDIPAYATELDDKKIEQEDYITQNNANNPTNQPEITRKDLPIAAPAAPVAAMI